MTSKLARLEALAERIAAVLPDDVQIVRSEFRNSLKPVLEAALARMDLVTREEFEAQAAVLIRTREKLEALEAQFAELEREDPR